MRQDQAILYNSLYNEVKLVVDNIKRLGFDVSSYENALKQINDGVCNNVKNNYVKGMAEASYVSFYTSGIRELNTLKTKLDGYDIYVKANNICNYIQMKLNNNITPRELNEFVTKIIYVLDGINRSATMDYDNEGSIVERIYDIAYNVIKFEIMLNGDSQLYLYIKNRETNMAYFNNLVLDEVSKVNLEDNKLIQMRMFKLGEEGLYSNYFDLELIKLLLLNDKADWKDKVVDTINNLATEIEDNTKLVAENYKEYENKLDIVGKVKNRISDIKRSITKRSTAILCLLACLSGIGVAIVKLAKKVSSDNDAYTKTSITYSTIDDSYTEEQEEVFTEDNTRTVTVKVYSKTDKNNKRNYEEYDLSEYSFDTLEEYSEYVSSHDDLTPVKTSHGRTKGYKDGYVEVIRDDYEYYGKDFNQKKFNNLLLMAYWVAYLFAIVFVNTRLASNKALLSKLIDDIKWLKDNKKDYKEYLTELKELLDKLIELINSDEKMREEFLRLYNENMFLLDDPEELYTRIDDLEYIDKTKKLIREKK